MLYEKEKDFIVSEIKKAIKKFPANKLDVFEKTRFDLVTDVDKKIEAYLIDAIKGEFPADLILSEESRPDTVPDGRTWIIDPIDGTVNMARGIKIYGVQCALMCDGEVVMSVLFATEGGDVYWAIKDCGAYLNGKRITVNSGVSDNGVILSLGDYSHTYPEMAVRQHMSVGRLYGKISKIRIIGSACMIFAYEAAGCTDAAYVLTKNLWDLLPGYLLCKEAGAIISNPDGEEYKIGDCGIVASAAPWLHDEIIKSLSPD